MTVALSDTGVITSDDVAGDYPDKANGNKFTDDQGKKG